MPQGGYTILEIKIQVLLSREELKVQKMTGDTIKAAGVEA
jgi:hypothetical protein